MYFQETTVCRVNEAHCVGSLYLLLSVTPPLTQCVEKLDELVRFDLFHVESPESGEPGLDVE